ncbi:MAG: acyltransferase family protein [Chthoniobacterales bacterium]
MSGASNRLDWVDCAKGISIILVVMMHSAYGVGDDLHGTGVLNWIIGWATPFRMPEFFMISGLFLGEVIARPWARYADRRAVHYLYFYFLWVILQVAFKVGLGTGDLREAAFEIVSSISGSYGVLWFITTLAIYSMTAKLLFTFHVPHWVGFVFGAILMLLQITSGVEAIDHFAMYFVYFYAGYAFAPLVFRIVAWGQAHVRITVTGLIIYALIEGYLVFAGGSELLPRGLNMGYASNPFVHLTLGFCGSMLICLTASLLVRIRWMNWLRWLGQHSIVVYLSFSIPMAATRTLILKMGVLRDISTVSVIVWLVALGSPIALYGLMQLSGRGKFLFERPEWAHVPGTPGSIGYQRTQVAAE